MACQGILGSPCNSHRDVLTGSLALPGSCSFLSARGSFCELRLVHPLARSQRLSRQAQVGLVQQALCFPSKQSWGEVSMGFAKFWMRNVLPRIFSAFLLLLVPPVSVQAGFVCVTSPRCPQGGEDGQPLEQGAERLSRARFSSSTST